MTLAILGVAATLAAALIGAWVALRSRSLPRSRLELIDVLVPEPGDPVVPVVDLKVNNLGGQTAVIKRVRIEVVAALTWGPPVFLHAVGSEPSQTWSGPLRISEDYDANLTLGDFARAGAVLNVPTSQKIAGGDVDRFQIRLRIDSDPPSCTMRLLRLTLVYDGRNREVEVPLVAVVNQATVNLGSARLLLHRFTDMASEVIPDGTQGHGSALDPETQAQLLRRLHFLPHKPGGNPFSVEPEWFSPYPLIRQCEELLEMVERAEACSPALQAIEGELKTILAGLPNLQ
jgi:hypothetical protein